MNSSDSILKSSVWEFFSPFSQEFQEAEKTFHENFSKSAWHWKQAVVVIVSIIGGLFLIVGAFPVFRWIVEALNSKEDSNLDKVDKIAQDHLVDSFKSKGQIENIPSFEQGETISDEKVTQCKELLENISIKYRNFFEENDTDLKIFGRAFRTLRKEFKPGIRSQVQPDDCKQSNIILDCLDEEDVYFLPISNENPDFLLQYSTDPKQPDQLKFLVQVLKAAFLTGKELVVVRLCDEKHAVAAGFSVKGKFKIIDSMSGCVIDMAFLYQSLNEAQIQDRSGKVIQFKGEYINTHVQSSGHECVRFATLYCYQMYKRKSLEAYQEVNGAFSEGKLKQFEDYKSIDGTKKLRSLTHCKKNVYTSFMQSWAYRTRRIKEDTWKKVTFHELQKSALLLQKDWDVKLEIYVLEKNLIRSPKNFELMDGFHLLFRDGKKEVKMDTFVGFQGEQEIHLTEEEWTSAVLGSLVSLQEKRLLIFEKDQKPRLLNWLPGQSLHAETKQIV